MDYYIDKRKYEKYRNHQHSQRELENIWLKLIIGVLIFYTQ